MALEKLVWLLISFEYFLYPSKMFFHIFLMPRIKTESGNADRKEETFLFPYFLWLAKLQSKWRFNRFLLAVDDHNRISLDTEKAYNFLSLRKQKSEKKSSNMVQDGVIFFMFLILCFDMISIFGDFSLDGNEKRSWSFVLSFKPK